MQTKFEQNLAIVKQAFADFQTGNIQGIVDVSADDIVWASYEQPDVPFAGTFKGKQGVVDFFTSLGSNVVYNRFETNEFFGDDSNLVVRGHHAGTIIKTGKPFGHDFMMHFKLRDGKIYDYFVFVDVYQEGLAFN